MSEARPLAQHIASLETLLFVSGEPLALSRLKELLGVDKDALTETIAALAKRYAEDASSGLMLIEHAGRVELASKAGFAPLVESLTKSTLQENLSKATLEVLSIVAYRSPIARAEIEAIRGVNCSYTLRALLIRGLVEREGNPGDARGYLYRPTFAFLEKLGLAKIEDLPDYAALSTDERMHIVVPTLPDASEAPDTTPSSPPA